MKTAPVVPEVPQKGSTWDKWLLWGLSLVTALVTWYMAWQAEQKVEEVKRDVSALVAK